MLYNLINKLLLYFNVKILINFIEKMNENSTRYLVDFKIPTYQYQFLLYLSKCCWTLLKYLNMHDY